MIHFWDMDYTLVNNDCDVSWKKFLVEKELAPPSALIDAEKFYQQYLHNSLDIQEFIRFQLLEFTQHTCQEMEELCQEHFEQVIKPKIFVDAEKLVYQQLQATQEVCLITATNNFIAKPLADYLGIRHLKATRVQKHKQSFTGDFIKPYCNGKGKIVLMKQLLNELNLPLTTPITYYGDSINDIPVFRYVNQAVVINPQGELLKETLKNGWQQLQYK